MATKPMKTLWEDGPFATIECECGAEFDIDATVGENLDLILEPTRHYVPQCPKCGAIQKEEVVNQCDGCRAGKPVDENGNHRMGEPGGYSNLQGCEKDKYK